MAIATRTFLGLLIPWSSFHQLFNLAILQQLTGHYGLLNVLELV
jgi:hypothetical protein